MPTGSGPISANRLHLMIKILTNAGQDRSLRTRDLVQLSRTPSPEIQPVARQLQDLIIREVKAGNMDFITVAKQGADLVEAAQTQINALQEKLQLEQQQSTRLQAEIDGLKNTLEQREQQL